jgi:hypothetical protein
MVEETRKDLPAEPAGEQWPKREETREFQAVQLTEGSAEPRLPPVQPVPDESDEGPWAGRDFAWG